MQARSLENEETVFSHLDDVMNVWKESFHGLYNRPQPEEDVLYTELINRRIYLEDHMFDENFTPNIIVNQSISFDEVEKVIDLLKTKNCRNRSNTERSLEITRCQNDFIYMFQ